jgi:hypothetical protein
MASQIGLTEVRCYTIMELPIDLKLKKNIIIDYRLNEIVCDDVIKSNIAFTLQYIHYNLDIMRIYNFQKSVRATTCKQLLINTFAVLEGIMLAVAYAQQCICNEIEDEDCKMPCEYYFANDTTKFIHFDTIKKYLSKIRALKFSEHGKQFIEIAKDLRNNIHIGKSIEIWQFY